MVQYKLQAHTRHSKVQAQQKQGIQNSGSEFGSGPKRICMLTLNDAFQTGIRGKIISVKSENKLCLQRKTIFKQIYHIDRGSGRGLKRQLHRLQPIPIFVTLPLNPLLLLRQDDLLLYCIFPFFKVWILGRGHTAPCASTPSLRWTWCSRSGH